MAEEVVARQLARLQRIASQPGYRERSRVQMLSWAFGRPYHDHTNDECCPDFSCCYPDLFNTDTQERWRQYREKYCAPPPNHMREE